MTNRSLWLLSLSLCFFVVALANAQQAKPLDDNLATGRLVAWCIVPFDAKRRGPAERAQMLKELGIKRCAYDWRQEHVDTFEEEILQYKKHGIEFFAFWDTHPEAFKLFKKHQLTPQIWRMMPNPPGDDQAAKIEAAVEALAPLARTTAELGCKLGIYNHGGWNGQPANMVAVCQRLRKMGHGHVGIVYNFHHGHEHIRQWKQHWQQMLPWLLCLNINGMNPGARPKILGVGQGKHELEMLQTVRASGYDGPVGILDHRSELDTKKSLQENLDGLQWVRAELKNPGSGGPKPVAPATSAIGSFRHRQVAPGKAAYRRPPLTVVCRATLPSKQRYNILVASDTKASSAHWELFTQPGNGWLTAYLPGYEPDHIRSKADVCDGEPHQLTLVYEANRGRLFVDGKLVADTKIKSVKQSPIDGGLGIGRLVNGQLGCDGHIHWLHLRRGSQVPPDAKAAKPAKRDDATVGFWEFKEPDQSSHEPRRTIPYSPEVVGQWVADAEAHGNAQQGVRVFAAAKFACVSCHQVLGHGGIVGPELTAPRKRTRDHLVESVFWPRREVRPEFQVWQALTEDGSRWKGYRLPAPEGTLRLKDPATGNVVETALDEVERLRETGTLMPDGLAQAMTHQQRLDVLKFLFALNDPATSKEMREHFSLALKHAHSHAPATFPYDRKPLKEEDWPNWQHTVNRDRVYDFYTKQAEHFLQQPHLPMVVSAFPGLDGGQQGHWGNQNDTTWEDNRWNDVKLGSVQVGVFRGQGKTVARGVCLQLGDDNEVSACFNPETLTYEVTWSGGFVAFSKFRHGFLDGLKMTGKPAPFDPQVHGRPFPDAPFQYHGFYRSGRRVVFAYRIGEIEYLDAPWVKDGMFQRIVMPRDEHPLRELAEGGPRQWPQVLTGPVRKGTSSGPYVVDTFVLPRNNPWNALFFCGGHDFLADGSAMVCTMHGDVWHVRENDGGGGTAEGSATWRRFASGLHHPQGLVVVDDEVYVQGRDQITRLKDLNNDGEADFYECFSKAFETSPAGHDFICGLERDAEGRFYTATGNQGLVRISADGNRAEVLATGFRNPDGLGLTPGGVATVPCSEGSWTPASQICAVRVDEASAAASPPFFGLGGPRKGRPELPLVYLPRGLDNSSGGQTYIDSDRWGPLYGAMVHLSFGTGSHFLLLQDEVKGQLQGAVVPLRGEFLSGAHRGRFNPHDGQLYVSGMDGWGSYTVNDGCFQRVRYTGRRVQLPKQFHVHENGVVVQFTEDVSDVAGDPTKHFAQCWNYRYSGAYGSPEFSTTHPGVVGHDVLSITSAHVMADGRTVFFEIPDLQPCSQLHLRLRPEADEPCDLFATVHCLDEPFRAFRNYRAIAKTIAAHPMDRDLAMAANRKPNRWTKKIANARKIRIETGKNLTYATRQFEVAPQEAIELVLANPDVVPHNWALIAPDTLSEVGGMANHLVADPDAFARQYIPATDKVLVHTDVVGPGAEFRIYFRAPAQPGRYPYLCTFPGHWMVMNGEMIVKP